MTFPSGFGGDKKTFNKRSEYLKYIREVATKTTPNVTVTLYIILKVTMRNCTISPYQGDMWV